MHGTFESKKTLHSFVPNNVPKPITWGTYKSLPDIRFYICAFHDMLDDFPGIGRLGALVTKVHKGSIGKSLHGKYGFHVATHLASISNDNTWCDTREEWFANAMRRMLQAEAKSHGANEELSKLTSALVTKGIPRLL